MILGVIPARAGSKGIPNKNLHRLNDKPLIQYTIDEVKKSKQLDMWLISTDIEVLMQYEPLHSIPRPAELCQDETPMLPVIQHAVAIAELMREQHVEAVVTLQPTSPLRTAKDIDECIRMFKLTKCDSLVTVHPVCNIKKYYNVCFQPMVEQTPFDKNIDNPMWQRNGAVFVTRRDLLDAGRLFSDKPYCHILPKVRSVDVDDYEDLAIAEALIKQGVVG